MKHPFWIGLLCLALAAAPAAAQVEVKAGGGVLTDPSRLGGHVSLEIPLSDDYPTYLAPFFEYYVQDDAKLLPKMMPVGASLLYKALMSSYGGMVYFGVLGGLLMSRDIPDPFGAPTGVSSNDALIGVGGGGQFGFNDRFGVFGQIRWFRLVETGGDNNISFQAGLALKLGEL